jgi:hypothetical protein
MVFFTILYFHIGVQAAELYIYLYTYTNLGLEGEDGKTDHDGGSEEKGLINQNIALQCNK